MHSADTVTVEFHCHSDLSFDGRLTPEELAERFAEAGIRYCALTDHDILGGQHRFASALDKRGIGHISGLEISVSYPYANCHLLAYGFNPRHAGLLEMLEEIRNRIKHVDGGGQGVIQRIRAALFKPQPPPSPPAPPPAPGHRASRQFMAHVGKIIRCVHQAGGIACLAHPLSFHDRMDRLDEDLGRLSARGLDGIEAIYKPYGENLRQILIRMARKHRLLVCSGSDFHGYARRKLKDPVLNDSPFNYGPADAQPELPGMEMPRDHFEAFLQAVGKEP